MSATSPRHARALADAIAEELGIQPNRVEGYAVGEWVLLDCGDIVVHIFYDVVRPYFNLDKLWGHVPALDLSPSSRRPREAAGARPRM